MKKILLVSAFALFGTFAMANEIKTTESDYVIQIEMNERFGCTAYVWYNGALVTSFTSYSYVSVAQACASAQSKADRYVSERTESLD